MSKLYTFLIVSLALFLSGCSLSSKTAKSPSLITASFYPLANIASQVAGTPVESVIPTSAEPHDFEPTPKDLIQVYNSKIFIFNGAGLDPWAEKIAPELEERGIKVIELANYAELLTYAEEEHEDDHHEHHDEDDHADDDHPHDEDEDHHDDHSHSHSGFDPHFWLDPIVMQNLAKDLSLALQSVNPEDSAIQSKTDDLISQLVSLDADYQSQLASCSLNQVVTSHAAFNYLAKRYNFQILSVSGMSPEEEPSPTKLAELTHQIQSSEIKYVLFETLVDPKIAQTLASEAGVDTLVFNPIEGLTAADQKANLDYFKIMYQNLETLKTALNCQ